MKALSIRQPWAWLIVHGYKDIENRSWSTQHRGPLLIHAGKTFDREALRWITTAIPDLRGRMPFERQGYRLGGLVGKVTLVDCARHHDSLWFTGPFGWVLTNAIPITFVPYRGQLRLFEVPDNLLDKTLNPSGRPLST